MPLIEEMGKPLAFHAAYNWKNKYMEQMNRFISVHALGFPYYNILHMTNLVINGIFERFPKLKTDVDRGRRRLGAVPDAAPRQRIHDAPVGSPLLKRLPSEYMAEQYYATQPLEMTKNRKLLEATFKAINAETNSASRPIIRIGTSTCRRRSTICRSCRKQAKRNILGGNAKRVFNLEPVISDVKQRRLAARAG